MSITPALQRYRFKHATVIDTVLCLYILYFDQRTFVIHVGGHLDHAEAEVDRKVVKVIVGLQDELPS